MIIVFLYLRGSRACGQRRWRWTVIVCLFRAKLKGRRKCVVMTLPVQNLARAY